MVKLVTFLQQFGINLARIKNNAWH